MNRTALHCLSLYCNVLNYTALHCTSLHCTALQPSMFTPDVFAMFTRTEGRVRTPHLLQLGSALLYSEVLQTEVMCRLVMYIIVIYKQYCTVYSLVQFGVQFSTLHCTVLDCTVYSAVLYTVQFTHLVLCFIVKYSVVQKCMNLSSNRKTKLHFFSRTHT